MDDRNNYRGLSNANGENQGISVGGYDIESNGVSQNMVGRNKSDKSLSSVIGRALDDFKKRKPNPLHFGSMPTSPNMDKNAV